MAFSYILLTSSQFITLRKAQCNQVFCFDNLNSKRVPIHLNRVKVFHKIDPPLKDYPGLVLNTLLTLQFQHPKPRPSRTKSGSSSISKLCFEILQMSQMSLFMAHRTFDLKDFPSIWSHYFPE